MDLQSDGDRIESSVMTSNDTAGKKIRITYRAKKLIRELCDQVDLYDRECALLARRDIPGNEAVRIGFERERTKERIANVAWSLRDEVRKKPSQTRAKQIRKPPVTRSAPRLLVEVFVPSNEGEKQEP